MMREQGVGRLSWSRLQPFGAVVDIDLNLALTEAEQAALRSLLWEHEVLVFHGQALTHERQKAILRLYGPVRDDFESAHYISNDAARGVLGDQELAFHSDASFLPIQRTVLSLFAVELRDGASATRYASGSRALAQLPQDLRRRIDGLTATHVQPLDPYLDRSVFAELPPWLPHHSHPLVLTHPVSGKPVLFIQERHVIRIDGLPIAESQALLQELERYVYGPANILEHVWRVGDLVIWDNVSTQHARRKLANVGPRTLQKVQVVPASFEEQWAHYAAPELQAALRAMAG